MLGCRRVCLFKIGAIVHRFVGQRGKQTRVNLRARAKRHQPRVHHAGVLVSGIGASVRALGRETIPSKGEGRRVVTERGRVCFGGRQGAEPPPAS